MFPVGSSHSSKLSRFTRARAIATRWHSPPESVVGGRVQPVPEPDRAERADRGGEPATSG